MTAVAVACLVVSALLVAIGVLVANHIDVDDQGAELDDEGPAQTFDQWRMTGQQAWPAPRPAAPTAAPSSTTSTMAPTSPDSMVLDVEAMIARVCAEIGELVDDADRKMGELIHA